MKRGFITIVSALSLAVSGCVSDGVGYVDYQTYSPLVYYEPAPIIVNPPIIYREEHHREFRPSYPPIYRPHSQPEFRHPGGFGGHHIGPGPGMHRGHK